MDYLAEPRTIDGFFDQLDRILLYIVRHTERMGRWVSLNLQLDYPIAFAKDSEEFKYMLSVLPGIGYLEFASISEDVFEYRLTPEGLKRVDEIRPRLVGAGKQCFVAMWFDDKLNEVYSFGFEPAIRDAGYDPVRIDKVHHNEKICDRIIAEIRRSRFVVADFTGHRGGVYFEAGFAMGLGLPVIWTCRDDALNKTHFDTRQYNHIEWQASGDLRQKLYERICATMPLMAPGRPLTMSKM